MGALLVIMLTTIAAPPAADSDQSGEAGAPRTARVVDPTYTPQVGDRAFLDSGAKDEDGDPYAVVTATSVDDFVNVLQIQFVRNTAAIDAMEKAKTILYLDAGTAVIVTGMRPVDFGRVQLPAGVAARRAFCTEIKVLDGEHKGKVLYTMMHQVARYVTVPIPDDESSAKPKPKPAKAKRAKSKNKPAPIEKTAAEKPAADADARAESLLKLGRSLEKAGKAEGAVEFYRKVMKQFPQSAQAKVAEERIKALGKGSF